MKRIIFVLSILLLGNALHAQYVYTIKADSVKITNTCDTAELIIENHTQTVPGFLFNRGRGRTEFRRIAQLDDTSVVVGGDTIHLGRGSKNFANADLKLTGERIHDGARNLITYQNFDGINMLTKTSDDLYTTDLQLWGGLYYDYRNEHFGNTTSMVLADGLTMSFKNPQLGAGARMQLGVSELVYRASSADGEGSAGMTAEVSDNWGTFDYTISDIGGRMYLYNKDYEGNGSGMYMYAGDSLNIYCSRGEVSAGLTMTQDRVEFINKIGINDFRLVGLPASTSATDSMLVVDGNGQVRKRPQSPQRTSATVTGSAYTIPAGIDVVFVNYAAGQATITLPTGTLDREITIKNLHTTNTVVIAGLDSNESNFIATRGAITIKYTGSAWVGISKY
ncbi:hypothetical protein [Niastella sp. OAS944]|uniref:hypothetical protein n=1 Tax=Niastella sp. OAS944 TaxID=2664089 RepID=UPI00349291D1|nr:hypothetical protein [Chitinophagaceae bacterium OAS944]